MTRKHHYVKNFTPFPWVTSVLLSGIILIGLLFRTYHLTTVPNGFFADEASIGYNAYSILTRGVDEYNTKFPVFFRSLDDYKAPIAIYATVPFVAVLGLNEFSTRLPSALFGLLTVIFLFLLGKSFGGQKLGLLSAFAGSITPWLIHYDRVAFLMNIYATFFTATIYFFVRALNERRFLPYYFICAGLTLYTYQPAKLIIPLLVVGLFLLFPKTFLQNKRQTIVGFLSFFIISLPMIVSFFSPIGMARFNEVGILSSQNKGAELLMQAGTQYITQLSPLYFFVKGELTFNRRHFTNGLTPLLAFASPFIAIGIIVICKKYRSTMSRILLFWLALYPVSAALVRESPFSSRCIIGAPLFAIITGIGIVTIQNLIRKQFYQRLYLTIIILCLLVNALFFARFYFFTYPQQSAGFYGWQYGPKEIMTYFLSQKDNYDDLYMSGEFNGAYIYALFYDPTNLCSGKCKISDFMREPTIYNPKRKQLFSLSPDYVMKSPLGKYFHEKKTIYYPNGAVAFKIGEIVQ